MSFQLDREYLLMASPSLERFSKQSNDVWKCRCPFCGDSAKNRFKTRMYIYKTDDAIGFFCHNCNETGNVYKLVKQVNAGLANEYLFQNYLEKGQVKKKEFQYTSGPQLLPITSSNDINLPTIESLPEDHPAKVYLNSRMIPVEQFKDLYWADNFRYYIRDFSPEEDKVKGDEGRVVLPIRDRDGALIAVQGNSLYGEGIKYITVSLRDETLVWNFDKVDLQDDVFVFEGAYDAMFIPNSVAVLTSALWKYTHSDGILVFDNEPRNKEIVEIMNKAIVNNRRVCIWPHDVGELKDINEMVKAGFTLTTIHKMILANTYKGLRATLEYNNWKKV